MTKSNWCNTLYYWPFPNPESCQCCYRIFSSVRVHGSKFISVFCILSCLSYPSSGSPTLRCLWRFTSASWRDLRRNYADFPWNDYRFHVRDSSLGAKRRTEIIMFSLEVSIPHSFSRFKLSKPWFKTACYRAIYGRKVGHKGHLSRSLQSSLSRSARNTTLDDSRFVPPPIHSLTN